MDDSLFEGRHVLGRFSLKDMSTCGRSLREACRPCQTMEEAANCIVDYLYESLVEPATGDRACALVRFFVTTPYARLDEDLKAHAFRLMPAGADPANVRCLTLVATRGDEPPWNSRLASKGHKTIPLVSEEMVKQFPMVSQLIQQLGFKIPDVINPRPDLILNLSENTFGVFYVPEAIGSPYIVAQEDFVVPYRIKSVLGFGGMLPSGDVFATILFSKSFVPKEAAQMFQTIALNVKLAVLGFTNAPMMTARKGE